VTLLEAPEPAPRLLSNSLSPVSVTRLVSAATVDATFVVGLAVELDVLLGVAPVPREVAAAAVFSAEAAPDALRRL
jgi:hypothetical protein